MESPDAKHWEEAMREEVNSLKENNIFTLTKLPESRQAVGADGFTQSRKAHLWLKHTNPNT